MKNLILERCFKSLVLLVGLMCVSPSACLAQIDFLERLFRAPQAPPAVFPGMPLLRRALAEAQTGDVSQSLKSVREAFKGAGDGKSLGEPAGSEIAGQLLMLSEFWRQREAPPAEVAAVLRDIVLPPKHPDQLHFLARPAPLNIPPWDYAHAVVRPAVPRSIGAELVAWSARAQELPALQKSLEDAQQNAGLQPAALSLLVSVALERGDVESAKKQLQELAKLAGSAKTRPHWDVVFSAVVASLKHPATQAASLELLDVVLSDLRTRARPDDVNQLGGIIWLRTEGAKLHARAGRKTETLQWVEAASEPLAPSNQIDEQFRIQLQREQLLRNVVTLLEAGLISDALDKLAPYADEPTPPLVIRNGGVNVAVALGRALQQLPAGDRYELLSKWALVQEPTPRLRDLTEFIPEQRPVYGDLPHQTEVDRRNSVPAAGVLHDVYSTSWHLLLTARELGRLEDLLKELTTLAPETPQHQVLLTLGLLLRDSQAAAGGSATVAADTIQQLRVLLTITTQEIPTWEMAVKQPLPMLTCVVAAEAGRHSQWADLALEMLDRLITHSQRVQSDRPRAHLRLTHAEVLRRFAVGMTPGINDLPAAAMRQAWSQLQPRGWLATSCELARQHASGTVPPTWLGHDGCIQHLAGPYESVLVYSVPLVGEFEIQLECREGGWAEGSSSYGGLFLSSNAYSNRSILHGAGHHGAMYSTPVENLLNHSPWNQHTLQVSAAEVRYLVNGQVIHSEAAGLSAPWFALNSDWGRNPVFRNFRIKGTPIIPRSILLLTDSRLRGWVSRYHEESRPYPLRYLPQSVLQPAPNNRADAAGGAQNRVPVLVGGPDWAWQANELRSTRREQVFPGPKDSWMHYYRPLHAGEVLQYDFYYQPGQFEVHPTLGHQAFLLGDDGIKAYSLTDEDHEVMAVDRTPASLTSDPLPLKAGDWNRLQIERHENGARLSMNGKLVLECPLPAAESPLFGFYHDASQTQSRIRDVVLTGDWPAVFTAELRDQLENPGPVDPTWPRQFATVLIQEQHLADNAYAVFQQALTLEPNARYDFLYRWVMPGNSHRNIRMAGALTPTHPVPTALETNPIDLATLESRLQGTPRMVQTGGNFVCPAILLALTAAELNRLGELIDAVDKIQVAGVPDQERARLALLGIAALLDDRPQETSHALWECRKLLGQPENPQQFQRWAEPALCSLAILHPDTREAAYELLDHLQTSQIEQGKPGESDFGRFVRQLHGQACYLRDGGDLAAFGTAPALKQWQAITIPTAQSRGKGYPVAAWDVHAGEISLRGGHELELLYFQSPLQGDYEMRVTLSQFNWREIMPQAAGIATAMKYTHDTALVRGIRTEAREVPAPAPVEKRAYSLADYRVIVKNGRYTCYVNDYEIYTAEIPPGSDPWVGLQAWAGHSSRVARNLVITGNPTIPDELDLLAPPDLQGWMADYYGSFPGHAHYPWTKSDGELLREQVILPTSNTAAPRIENILRYHRPMLEDGEISYEFFYEPPAVEKEPELSGVTGVPVRPAAPQFLVHPALDRMVCLLEPEGVKIHWLTDGRFDRTGQLAGNVMEERGRESQTLPLKPGDWNAVRFAVQRDVLKITLNDEPVFEHAIEPTNLRHFGFFHYVNESAARIRNVRYRGDWPRTLPAVEQQEMAHGTAEFAKISPKDMPNSWSYDFTKSHFEPAKFTFFWNHDEVQKYIRPTAEGLRMHYSPNEAKPWASGVHPKLHLAGDFAVTLDYDKMTTIRPKEAWGSGLSFKVVLDQSIEAGLEFHHNTDDRRWTNMMRITKTPHEQYLYHAEGLPEFRKAGRLRLVRRGEVLYGFAAPAGTEDFELVSHIPVGLNDVHKVNLQIDCSDEAGGAEYIAKKLTIQAVGLQIVP